MNKTHKLIKNRYSRHFKKWTKTEYARLKELYPKYSNAFLGRKFRRTPDAVRIKALNIGLKNVEKESKRPEISYRLWTKKEDDFLKKHYQTMTSGRVADIIGRTAAAVKTRARGLKIPLKIRKFSKRKLKYLIDNIHKMSLLKIAQKLKCPYTTISHRAKMLGFKSEKLLNEKEKQYIKRWYPRKSAGQIAKKLNRSRGAIIMQAVKFGLHKIKYKKDKIKYWSADEVRKFIKLFNQGAVYEQIAQQLGRTLNAIDHKVERMKLRHKSRFSRKSRH